FPRTSSVGTITYQGSAGWRSSALVPTTSARSGRSRRARNGRRCKAAGGRSAAIALRNCFSEVIIRGTIAQLLDSRPPRQYGRDRHEVSAMRVGQSPRPPLLRGLWCGDPEPVPLVRFCQRARRALLRRLREESRRAAATVPPLLHAEASR